MVNRCTLQLHQQNLQYFNVLESHYTDLPILFSDDPPQYRLIGAANYLQLRIGDYSLNDDGIVWGYLPIQDFINLAVGFNTNSQWDMICEELGLGPMLGISSDVPSDVSVETFCRDLL